MITIYEEVTQGSPEWLEMRRGILTASEMKLILTPTLKMANNDKTRSHVYEIAAQRVTGYVEPTYIGDEMLRGMSDEPVARDLYSKEFSEVREVGFITNDEYGFVMGYSPDGIVGDSGLIEIKSRRQKFQMQVISENTIPEEHALQVQTGLLVSGREWLDYISYCGGMPMMPIRVYRDEAAHKAIIEAAEAFEENVALTIKKYKDRLQEAKWVETERAIEAASDEIL